MCELSGDGCWSEVFVLLKQNVQRGDDELTYRIELLGFGGVLRYPVSRPTLVSQFWYRQTSASEG